MIKHIRNIFSLFDRRIRLRIFGLFGLMIGTAVLETLGIGLFIPLLQVLSSPEKVATNPYISPIYRLLGEGTPFRFLVLFGISLAIFFAFKNVLLLGFQYLQGRFVHHEEAAFATRLFGVYLARPYAYHLRRNSAQLMHNVTIATASVFQSGLMPLLNLVMEVFIAVGVFTAILIVSPVEGLTAGGILIATLGFYYIMLRVRLEFFGSQIHRHGGQSKLWVNQGIGAIKETKILGREGFFREAFGRHRGEEARYRNFAYVGALSPRPLIETVAVAVLVLVMIMIVSTTEDVSEVVPALGIFGVAAFRLLPSLNRIAASLANLKIGAAAVEEIHRDSIDMLHLDQAESRPRIARGNMDGQPIGGFKEKIELKNIDYAYENSGGAAVRDISLTIRPGESVALVGPSGAGKTTLADIILGLLTPTKGQILVDGHDVHENIGDWQRSLGYVPQHIYLFDDSVRSNVALGFEDQDIDDDQVQRALRMAAVDSVINDLPEGAQTVLGENGVRLSGGQRQRIGIARALYSDPGILILDEATSSLDTETEQLIMASINALRGQKTLIVIAHRLSTVRNCDRLILLDQGRIVDSGSFDELLTRSPLFQKLVTSADLPEAASMV